MSAAEIGHVVSGQVPARASGAQPTPQPRPSASWWGDVWRRFRRQRLSLVAAVVLITLAILAILAPMVSPYDPTQQFRRDGLSPLGEPLAPLARNRPRNPDPLPRGGETSGAVFGGSDCRW